jgi:hypothetical protein
MIEIHPYPPEGIDWMTKPGVYINLMTDEAQAIVVGKMAPLKEYADLVPGMIFHSMKPLNIDIPALSDYFHGLYFGRPGRPWPLAEKALQS